VTASLQPLTDEDVAQIREALEAAREARAATGVPGPVFLRVDDYPGKPTDWRVELGPLVVARKRLTPRNV
jgi:hypothetical protein